MSTQQSSTSSPILFFSYAPEDEPLRNELEKHLSLLQRRGVITAWYDRQILPGADWAHAIDLHLQEATVILLLISPDFIASDYRYSNEMQVALDRYRQGQALVIPILLRPVDWQDAPFSHLQCLPSNKKPITLWENQDAAFFEVATAIHAAVVQLHRSRAGQNTPHISQGSHQARQHLLKRVRTCWVQDVLEQSLYHATLIALGLHEQPDALENPWRLIVQETERPVRPLPPGTSIVQVYDEADGALLILGEPGSGKTTLLLQLARELLDRAEQDEIHPMPAIFNLSSWAVKEPPLADWLVEELNLRYQVPSQFAESWISANRILPLLDGLDEVAPTHRASCLKEINTYISKHSLASLVVCSRSEEYFSQTARVLLRNAVTIQPLTNQQINEYLASAGKQLAALSTVLHHDPALLKLATAPLMLNILTLAYQGKTVEELPTVGSPTERRQQIFAAYVQRMFEHRGAMVHYTRQQAIAWLGWLANQMAAHNQTEFYLDSIQPDWLWGKFLRRCYEWTVGKPIVCFLQGLFHAVYCGVLAVLVATLVTTLPVGINQEALGILLGIFSGGILISLISGILYGWRRGLYIAIAGISTGAVFGALIGHMFAGRDRSIMGLIIGLSTGEMVGLFASIIGKEGYSRIYMAPVISWSWEQLRRNFSRTSKDLWVISVLTLVSGVLTGTTVGVEKGVFSGLGMGTAVLLGGLFVFCFSGGIQSKALNKREQIAPNRLIWRSARKGLYSCLAGGVCAFLGTWLIISSAAGPTMGWHCALIAGFLFSIIAGWFEDWDACVRHLVLRVLLWRAGFMPKNYTRFLDYAVERIFLRKTGRGYIFIHRQLLEYFARLTLPELEMEHPQKASSSVKNAIIYHNRGRLFEAFGEPLQAIRNYTHAIELDRKEISFYLDRGRMYIQSGEYQQAIEDYTSAIGLDPNNAWAYRQRGRAYRALKVYEQTVTDFTQAIKLDSERALFYRDRGWSYEDNGENEKALADFTSAIKLAPQEEWGYEDRGRIFIKLQEYKKAIADLSIAIELAPQRARFYKYRAFAFIKLQEYEKAITDFTQAMRLDPQNAYIFKDRGRAYRFAKEDEKALADFTRAIELAPQNMRLYEERGSIYAQREEYEKALGDFNRAIELEPSNVSLYYQRGFVFLRTKVYTQTIEDCTHIIELDATYKGAYFLRGNAYLWLKERKLANADFVRYATLTPRSISAAWRAIYSSLGKQRPGSEIIEALSEIIAIEPQSDSAQFCQGVTLGLQRNYHNGIVQLEQSIHSGKFTRDAFFWKGLFCAYSGQDTEAIRVIGQALEAGLPPILLIPLYWLEQEQPEMYHLIALPFLDKHGI